MKIQKKAKKSIFTRKQGGDTLPPRGAFIVKKHFSMEIQGGQKRISPRGGLRPLGGTREKQQILPFSKIEGKIVKIHVFRWILKTTLHKQITTL